jgi:chromosome partition protein MukB
MSRARATALALVNWKGVFYERYQLDRHVTALEGANGAGKTTVMIAAYVVLLPDMSRLRFTNLGETGATGGDKGVWGRLGAPSRPSYAALEIALAGGERLVAGVQLQRKAEPTLDLVPFIVTGLGPETKLRDLLLVGEGTDDSVPTLDELRAQVAKAGARIEVYPSAKDYFAALFDRGVTPLRMGTDEERNKLNEMLRTSMTGGISRALTSDLRAFLLKEETGLGDALSRMRANLDACRRTRIEVAEARRLERELAGVYDAGQAMIAAALLAARTLAEEQAARADAAAVAHDEAQRAARQHEDAAGEARGRHEAFARRLVATAAAYQEAVARAERALRGQALLERVRALAPDLARTRQAAETARARQDEAAGARETRRRERDQAAEDCDRAARGLADLQSGLEELHRNVQAHRHAVRRLADAREALGADDPGDDLDAALARTRAALLAIDVERMRADRDLASARARDAEYGEAMAALAAVTGSADVARAHSQAREALAVAAELEALEARLPALASERERSAILAARQAAAQTRASALGLASRLDDPTGHVAAHLADVEAAFTQAEDGRRAAEAQADVARRTRDALRKESRDFEHAASRWRVIDAAAARLEAALGAPVRSRDAVAAVRARLARDLEAARERVQDARRRREARLEQAAALVSPAVAVHPELLRLRDELDAELLSARYEDLDLADAARAQAELGPLIDALVVEDPAAAVRKLANLDRDIASVWIVGPGARAIADGANAPTNTSANGANDSEADDAGNDLVVRDGDVTRVTRLPSSPTLGRRARERRAGDLRAQAEALAAELEDAIAAQRRVEALAEDADRLLEEGRALDAGDPATAIAAGEAARRDAEVAERVALDAAREARVRGLTAKTRAEGLRALLAEAFLLEPVDHAARAQELATSLQRAASARAELARTAEARRALGRLLDALRERPVEDDATTLAAARATVDGERERLFRAREALEDVARNRDALGLGHLEGALAERGAIAPALEAQLASARATMKSREDALRAAEDAWDEATTSAQRVAAEREAIEAQVARLQAELAGDRLGEAPPPTEAQDAMSRLAAERASLEAQERAASTEAALAIERLTQAEKSAAVATQRLTAEQRAAAPAAARWAEIRARAATSSVLDDALAARAADAYEGRPSAALVAEAQSREEVLIDRLAASPGGAECAARLRAARATETATRAEPRAETGASGPPIERLLEAWLNVRDWIQRRLPAPLGEMPEPLQALGRLRRELETLEERLVRQDRDLRGNSEDVARGIDVQLRRAAHQVRRLNQHLEGIRFGSITGIRVQMRRIDRMEQVLRALREGAAQELLFQPNLPIEEALDEIFRRYGGGRGGSVRVLDYREYAELSVEVRRHDRGEWESASPAKLSTGEAIGVGAALMMVILTEWERDANLLRAKRATGSLRFLFLDEANRLSQDNLAVLFDLCRTLDLQLLIAAPEVAHADWNTTYRLVRRVGPDGQEEVLVSGRRTVPAGPEA